MKNLVYYFLVFISCNSCSKEPENSVKITDESFLNIDTLWTEKVIKTNEEWKKILTIEQYYVCREKGTETPFTYPLYKNSEKGVYFCVACKNPLFSSDKKFDSGTGWPSFYDFYSQKSVLVGLDNSFGMSRDEVTCAKCDSHLGHVFKDGPAPTGLRYCINGVALEFNKNVLLKKAVFAMGCFWCVEEIFENIKGVKTAVSGYSGGSEINPTYQQVSAGLSSHAEAVEVTYDANVVSYDQLLKVYFNSGDFTQVNGQGPDIGKQYRSIIFYSNDIEKASIDNFIAKMNNIKMLANKSAVEILPLTTFYIAEVYHQDYVKLNPNQAYVKAVSIPRFNKAILNFPELLK